MKNIITHRCGWFDAYHFGEGILIKPFEHAFPGSHPKLSLRKAAFSASLFPADLSLLEVEIEVGNTLT